MRPKLLWALFGVALAISGTLNLFLLPPLFAPLHVTPQSLAQFEAPPGTVGLWLEVYLTDHETGQTRLVVSQQSHSFARQFLDALYICLDQGVSITFNQVSGTGAADCTGASAFAADAAAAESECGIVIGTSSAAESVSSTALGAQIAHGVGAGQLSYGAMTINAVALSGGQTRIVTARVFTNNSGADIVANEVGTYHQIPNRAGSCAAGTLANTNAFLGIRDLATFTVINADTATVQYTLITNV